MTSVVDRFLKYVSFDTMSDPESETCPSSAKQKLLGAELVEEMKEMGIQDAHMDENGYVYGTVPGDPSLPTIGLIAHMDTSPDASGANIKTKIVDYQGAAFIKMPFSSFRQMSPPQYSTILVLMSAPEASGEVSIWAMRPMVGSLGSPGTVP